MSELPEGWAATDFEQVADIKLGKMLDKAKNRGEPTRYLRNVNVRWGTFDLDDVSHMPMSSDERAALSIRDGDILVCEGGEPGRSAVWDSGPTDLTFQKALMRIRPSGGIEPHLLAAFLRWSYDSGALERHFTGTTIKHLPQSALSRLPLALPPLPEQRRIVAKIDSVTGKSRRARDHLAHIPRLVQKYKQALLAAAFARVDQAAAARLGDATTKIGSGATPRGGSNVYETTGVPFIRSQNVYFEGFDPEGLVFIDDAAAKALDGVIVLQNDVLLNITGASIGRACIVPDALVGARVNQHVSIIRCKRDLDPRYLLLFLWSPDTQRWINSENYGVTRPALTKSMIADLEVPLGTIAQQQETVRWIENAFAWIDRLASEATSARSLIDHLDQAVLAKAFRGELVPQDPEDEPASTLLERIRAERGAAPKIKRGRKAKGA